jgi:hypothetical protein
MCKQLDWQIDCAAQICHELIPALSSVERFTLTVYYVLSDSDRIAERCDRQHNVARSSQAVHWGEGASYLSRAHGGAFSCAAGG